MKSIVELLMQKGKLFKKLSRVENKHLGTRRAVRIYFGVDTKKYFHTIIAVRQKSKLLSKDARDFETINTNMARFKDCGIKKKILILEGSICTKAKENLEHTGWVIYDIS